MLSLWTILDRYIFKQLRVWEIYLVMFVLQKKTIKEGNNWFCVSLGYRNIIICFVSSLSKEKYLNFPIVAIESKSTQNQHTWITIIYHNVSHIYKTIQNKKTINIVKIWFYIQWIDKINNTTNIYKNTQFEITTFFPFLWAKSRKQKEKLFPKFAWLLF